MARRGWTATTLLRYVREYVEKSTSLTDVSTIGQLDEALRNTIVQEQLDSSEQASAKAKVRKGTSKNSVAE